MSTALAAPNASRSPGADRRRHLLNTTLRLVAAGGVDAVTHRRVAKAAGVGEQRIILEPPILPEETGDVDAIMRELVAVFERFATRYPDQWLILHRYWVE